MLILALGIWATTPRPVVVAEYSGIIHPVASQFILRGLEEAQTRDGVFILQLNTPGGLMESMREVVEAFLNSPVPVVVYVAPRGARAASAGTFITLAAHVAAMAPATRIGAASPVSMQGQMDSVMQRKVTHDAATYIRTIARARGRNAAWAERAVREGFSIDADSAVSAGVVDFVAPSLSDLMERLQGWVVEGETLRLDTTRTVHLRPGLRERLLSLLANPNVAYMLLMLGFYGIFFELSNPGAIFPGVFGAISLVLALYAFQILPVNYAGILLLVLAMLFFLLEVKLPTHGLLGAGGVVAFLFGSLLLFDRSIPVLRISWATIGTFLILTALFFLFLVAKALTAQRRRVVTGPEGLVGERGEARTPITPEGGRVFVHGELWNAVSEHPVDAGQPVEVVAVRGMTLVVRPVPPSRSSER